MYLVRLSPLQTSAQKNSLPPELESSRGAYRVSWPPPGGTPAPTGGGVERQAVVVQPTPFDHKLDLPSTRRRVFQAMPVANPRALRQTACDCSASRKKRKLPSARVTLPDRKSLVIVSRAEAH